MAKKFTGKLTVQDVGRLGSGTHHDGPNLYLQVRGQARSWLFRYMMDGQRYEMGIGPARKVIIDDARRRADQLNRQVGNGINPMLAKREAKAERKLETVKRITFRECADGYIVAHRETWRSAKHRNQWDATLATYVLPVFGGRPVDEVDTELVMKVVEPIWSAKPETANRVRGRIESILDWAKARGYRNGENPARWRGHLSNLLPKRSKVRAVVHHPALPYTEIASFMTELRKREGYAASALEFLILTATRTGEALGARWSEIDLEQRLWTVPASRMKAGREHRVPLSGAAVTVLERMWTIRQSDVVFPGIQSGQPLSNMTMIAVLQRMDRADLTVHGFRSTFRDWAAECTTFERDVIEMALAHVTGNKVETAYRRGDLFDKRRRLMDAWAAYCDGNSSAEIIPIRA
jgi:integrase